MKRSQAISTVRCERCALRARSGHTFNAGDALTVQAGAIHEVRNVASGNAAELATYVVEKESRSSRWPSDPVLSVQPSPRGSAIQAKGGLRHRVADDGSQVLCL
jgi:hypothetical protein